jgi:galacturonosyltransferase
MKKLLIIINFDQGLQARNEIINQLEKSEYELYFAAPDTGYLKQLKAEGYSSYNVKINRRGLNPIQDFFLLISYFLLILRISPDIVLSFTVKPNIYGGVACRVLRVPQIANITGLGDAVENPGILQKLVLNLTKVALKRTRTIFFQNTSNKKFYEQLSLISAKQTKLLPGSGVNLEKHFYISYPKKDDTIRLVFIGRIMRDKGIEELINAFLIIHTNHSSVTCDIVGPFEEDSYRNLIDSYLATGAGVYLGVSSDIHTMLSEYNAVVLPSYHEGMSNVLLEAAATGRPVLASNVPGCRETFDEGISGFGFEPRSVDSLVQAIERFIAIPHEQKAAMGLAGRKKMEREFDRQIVVDAYMREIENILEENDKKDKKK